jgi:small subunit ribosomal protein S6
VLLLDLNASDDVRAKALADARAQVEAGGELVLEQSWGTRPLAYQIDHREQADYHLLQLHGDAALIEGLERNLRIADGVLRHRIIKLAPGTPAPPDQHGRSAPPATPVAAAAETVTPAAEETAAQAAETVTPAAEETVAAEPAASPA